MKYLHDPVASGKSVGPMELGWFTIFLIGFVATEAICAAVILEKIPCYTCSYEPCEGDWYNTCTVSLCLPGPVE
jgi:hypothetical protein